VARAPPDEARQRSPFIYPLTLLFVSGCVTQLQVSYFINTWTFIRAAQQLRAPGATKAYDMYVSAAFSSRKGRIQHCSS